MKHMPALRELQACIRDAILGVDLQPAASHIAADGIEPEARLQIYRHHVFTTLTAALTATFPVVCRLVDARFFTFAADRYIRQYPPAGACLAEYGATFPAFLAEFPPCREHAYLPDVARLEWAMHIALHADEMAPLDTARLAVVPLEAIPRLIFQLDPSVSFIASPWPIDRIWRANQKDPCGAGVVDLDSGGAHLEVRRVGGDVTMRAVSRPRHAFRQTLHEGLALEPAASAALALDPSFDLTLEICRLLQDELPVDFTLYSHGAQRGA
jgi:putative DNA-binding protein